ncbi:uncharacterized protein METZ01_LOCUS49404 [marine metagenome]|uniref:Lon N-terminal domain-containing protein n=1 Tax=marine metagenome TaxID=408172 RepID=A0A381RXK5_9ZZZZ
MRNLYEYNTVSDLPLKIPVFPLSGALLLPRTQLPLNIFEPRYLEMIDNVISNNRLIGMIQSKPSEENEFFLIGCMGRITSFSELTNNRFLITLTGICRFKILQELEVLTPYRQFKISCDDFKDDLIKGEGEDEADRERLLEVLKKYLEKNNLQADWEAINNSSTELLINSLCILSPYSPEEKQALLEAETLKKRNEILIAMTEMTLSTNTGTESIQ